MWSIIGHLGLLKADVEFLWLEEVGGGVAEVQLGVEHGSIAPRRKWTELILAEGCGKSLPHLS